MLVAIPSVWKDKYLMLVSCPMATDLVVPGGRLLSHADIEAVAEPEGGWWYRSW